MQKLCAKFQVQIPSKSQVSANPSDLTSLSVSFAILGSKLSYIYHIPTKIDS